MLHCLVLTSGVTFFSKERFTMEQIGPLGKIQSRKKQVCYDQRVVIKRITFDILSFCMFCFSHNNFRTLSTLMVAVKL